MIKGCSIVLNVCAVLGLILCRAAHAQTAEDLIGTWQLVSVVNTASDGTRSRPYGDHPVGTLILERNRRFAVLLIDPDVPKFASNNRVRGSADENASAVKGSLGYFGTYAVVEKLVTLQLEGSTYPNWTGAKLEFSIGSLDDRSLTWSVAAAIGGRTETVWRRAE